MARHKAEKSPFPKKRPVAKGLFVTRGTPSEISEKAKAILRDAHANESYQRDRKAKNG